MITAPRMVCSVHMPSSALRSPQRACAPRFIALSLFLALVLPACLRTARPLPPSAIPPPAPAPSPGVSLPWLKGQLHAHTDNSGDSYTPADSVVRWYATRGYDFVVLTDHNVVTRAESTPSTIAFSGVEITQNYPTCVPPDDGLPCRIHVNALFVHAEPGTVLGLLPPAAIPPDRLGRYLGAVDLARALHGIAQINHPNFAFSASRSVVRNVLLNGPVLLEIANQSGDVSNEGDASHPSTEALWDALWTAGFQVWGTATDDAHDYDDAAKRQAAGHRVYVGNRGWVMVHARRSPAEIEAAVARGDFYSSTGVTLSTVEVAASQLHVAVDPSATGQFTIEFIGNGGRRLASARGHEAWFTLGLPGITYVRAVVTDAAGHQAWTQPVRGTR